MLEFYDWLVYMDRKNPELMKGMSELEQGKLYQAYCDTFETE